MADDFIGLDVELDPSEIAQDGFDYMATNIPGWDPAEANPDTVLIETVAQEESVDRTMLASAGDGVFRRMGELIGILPLEPTQAVATSTWTMVDDAGYTIPAGTQVSLTAPDGSEVGFRTLIDVTVPNGSTVTAAGEVTLQAILSGAAGSGLADPVTLIDALAFVESVSVVGQTTGGTDGETDSEYLDRLSLRLRLQSTAAILPRDFEILATDIAEVARSVAIDGYNASTKATNQERTVTVAVVDDTGQPIPGPAKAEVLALLQARREVNFLVFVVDPDYTDVEVDFKGVALPGFDVATVEASAIAAITSYLSPANWGLPGSGDPGVASSWINQPIVRHQELSTVLNNVAGLDHWTTLTVGARKQATAAQATDLVTATAHGYLLDDPVVFRSLTGGAPLVVGTTYFVRDVTANTFKVAATKGGAAINITTDATAATMVSLRTSDVTLPGVVPMPQPALVIGDVV